FRTAARRRGDAALWQPWILLWLSLRLALGGCKPLAHDLGAVDVALPRGKVTPEEALQVRRLGQHQELVDHPQVAKAGHAQRHAQPDRRTQVDDLPRVNRATIPQRAIGAPHLVLDLDAGVPHHALAGALLGLDDLARHPLEPLDRFALAAPERGLVRDLEQIAHHLAVLAVEAAHVEA